jgi:hypothetical protein
VPGRDPHQPLRFRKGSPLSGPNADTCRIVAARIVPGKVQARQEGPPIGGVQLYHPDRIGLPCRGTILSVVAKTRYVSAWISAPAVVVGLGCEAKKMLTDGCNTI